MQETSRGSASSQSCNLLKHFGFAAFANWRSPQLDPSVGAPLRWAFPMECNDDVRSRKECGDCQRTAQTSARFSEFGQRRPSLFRVAARSEPSREPRDRRKRRERRLATKDSSSRAVQASQRNPASPRTMAQGSPRTRMNPRSTSSVASVTQSASKTLSSTR
jgi:hypothetical protein